MFTVGQKVVCIDASGFEDRLCQGAVYTVTSMNAEFLRVDCKSYGDDEISRGYYKRRFRPIVERKTDISIFKRMLTPQGVDA